MARLAGENSGEGDADQGHGNVDISRRPVKSARWEPKMVPTGNSSVKSNREKRFEMSGRRLSGTFSGSERLPNGDKCVLVDNQLRQRVTTLSETRLDIGEERRNADIYEEV